MNGVYSKISIFFDMYSGEYFFSVLINLNNFTYSNTVIDGSSSSQVEGYISREGNISIGGNNYDTYEVALGLDIAEVQNQTGNQFTADTISFLKTLYITMLNQVQVWEL